MSDQENPTRREFLVAAAAGLTLAGCNESDMSHTLPSISPEQASRKRKLKSHIAIVLSKSYEEDLFTLLKEYASSVQLPNLKGKKVLVKPNMVEYYEGRPITTHPSVLKAAVKLVDYLGAAQIIIAEGPGHVRDTELLLETTGIGQACKDLGLPFFDLNLDDLVDVPNTNGFSKFKSILLPKTALEADVIVSVPKMKCHHWVGVTASMKNLLGFIPGQKYGWPKNSVHYMGITGTTIDMVQIFKPAFAVVDAIIAMEGDGPINGTAKHAGFMILGDDVAAVDATCARTMSYSLDDLSYIRLAGKVVGNIEPGMIDYFGASVDSVTQEFKKPLTFTNKSLLKQASQGGS